MESETSDKVEICSQKNNGKLLSEKMGERELMGRNFAISQISQ
jgi:hypothetical protein